MKPIRVAGMRRALVVWGVVFTITRQGRGAPLMDPCGGRLLFKDRRWRGYALHLSPWRRDRFGSRCPGWALCIGRLIPQSRSSGLSWWEMGVVVLALLLFLCWLIGRF